MSISPWIILRTKYRHAIRQFSEFDQLLIRYQQGQTAFCARLRSYKSSSNPWRPLPRSPSKPVCCSRLEMGHVLLPIDRKCKEVVSGLQKSSKEIPCSLLYDAEGSRIYEKIVQLEEYYPYAAESALFEKNADRIVSTISPGSLIVELGCGTATKSAYLLDLVLSHQGSCQYVGIDVSATALKQGEENLLRQVPALKRENLHLIEGEYLEGLKQARSSFPNELFCILWLGSSIGNLSEHEAILFMKNVLSTVGPRCQFFLCTDMWKDATTLYRAYCDTKGVTERFIKNGMSNALSLLGHVPTEEEENSWIYHVEVNHKLTRVEMWLIITNGLRIEEYGVHVRPGERVLIEVSRKFRVEDVQMLATESGFYIQEAWRNREYGCQMLYSALQALFCCWDDTDAIFRKISDWSAKPIDLRHPFCFYYGHINAFTKSKLLQGDESDLDIMFSRGMDPIVLSPTECHKHPEAPSVWPSVENITSYVKIIRSSVMEELQRGMIPMRLVCMVLEHERMHQETLAYMIVQHRKATFEKSLSATGMHADSTKRPLQEDQNSGPMSPEVLIPAGEVRLGVDATEGVFVWDNEVPLYCTEVSQPFLVSSKAVKIKEFMEFVRTGGYGREDLWAAEDFALFKKEGYRFPATWSLVGCDYYVHGEEGSRHWTEAANEAVYVSLSEAQAYCKWAGCRVMSEEEYQRIVDENRPDVVGAMKDGGWEWTSSSFKPFPGFHRMSEYPEYSTDFFDGRHFVLKGSSPATHPALRRDSFRNFYQRQYRFVFAKFRCCRDVDRPL